MRHEFGLCQRAYYKNFDVNLAVKGHKDTNEICELQAANWYCILNGAPNYILTELISPLTSDGGE